MRTAFAIALAAALSTSARAAFIEDEQPPNPSDYIHITFDIDPQPVTIKATRVDAVTLANNDVWLQRDNSVLPGFVVLHIDGKSFRTLPLVTNHGLFSFRGPLAAGQSDVTFAMDNTPVMGPERFLRMGTFTGSGGYAETVDLMFVPEPASSAIMLAGLVGLAAVRRRM